MPVARQASASASIKAEDLARGLGVSPEDLKEFIAAKKAAAVPVEFAAVANSLRLPEPVSLTRRHVPMVTPTSSMTSAQVSCVLVINQPERLRLARQAVECFMEQIWPNRQLVIINGCYSEDGSPLAVTNRDHPLIIEKHVAANLTVGAMRNLGIDYSSGEWIMQWDDDDWSHPLRIAVQMGFRQSGTPVLLRHQIRFDTDGGTAFIHDDPAGIAGTLLFPRLPSLRYPDQTGGEDAIFRVDHFMSCRVVAENSGVFPAYSLSIAFYHRLNVTPRAEFLKGRDSSEFAGKWSMPLQDMEYLRLVIARYGVRADRPEGSTSLTTESADLGRSF